MERDLDSCVRRDRFAIFRSRIELPGLHRLDGFFIQAKADTAGHFDVPRNAVSTNDQAKNHGALILGLAGFFRILWIGRVGSLGSADASADTEDTVADAAATAFPNPWSRTDANTTAAARANATSRSRAVRGWAGRHRRSRIAEIKRVVRLQLNFRRHNHRRSDRKLGMIVSHHDCRRRNLLERLLWNSALRRLELVAIAAATAPGHFFGRRLHDRRIYRRREQDNILLRLFHHLLPKIVGTD